jgi:adenylate cyclase
MTANPVQLYFVRYRQCIQSMKWHFGHKLALIMATLVLIASCTLGYTMISRQFSMAENQFDATGSILAAQLASGAVDLVFTNDQLGLNSLVNSLHNQSFIVAAAVINRDNNILAHAGRRIPASTASLDFAYKSSGSFPYGNETVWFYAPVIFKEVSGGAVWIGLDKTELITSRQAVIRSGIFVVALLVLAVTFVAIGLGWSLGRPIQALIKGTKAIESGHYGFRITGRQSGEFQTLTQSFNNMAAGLEQKIKIEQLFSKFVSNPVAARYMAQDNVEITREGRLADASVIFVDLVGYTAFSEGRPPEEVAEVLNLYFTQFAEICHQYKGNVDKYIGDCAMLVFGCPQHDPEHRYHAMMCAVRIRRKIGRLNHKRREAGLPWLDIRIGLSGGTVLAGLLGSCERLQYTVIGKGANLAARLCDLAMPGQILTDKAFFTSINRRHTLKAQAFETLHVKGFQSAIETLVIDDRQAVTRPGSPMPLHAIAS